MVKCVERDFEGSLVITHPIAPSHSRFVPGVLKLKMASLVESLLSKVVLNLSRFDTFKTIRLRYELVNT